jgi:hypothetical protein
MDPLLVKELPLVLAPFGFLQSAPPRFPPPAQDYN